MGQDQSISAMARHFLPKQLAPIAIDQRVASTHCYRWEGMSGEEEDVHSNYILPLALSCVEATLS
jgi:hypothetical protein